MTKESILEKINYYTEIFESETIALRRKFHKIPELGNDLPKTRALLLEELSKYNVEVRSFVGNGGITATLYGKYPGKTIAYRADMDALPITEENQCDFQSQNIGKMHACGHDGHMAMAISILKVLAKLQDNLYGNVKFIFQPAEETSGGAAPMIADGVLKNPDVDYIFGTHIWPGIESGKLGLKKGPLMAGTDIIDITIVGKGGHGGIPHNAINPIIIATKVIESIQSISSLFIDSSENVVISICSIVSGEVNNVIPREAKILGTVRTFSSNAQDIIIEKIERILHHNCAIYGAKGTLNYQKNFPPTINDPNVIETLGELLKNSNFSSSVTWITKPSMGAEDFSYFLQAIPGAYLFLGTKNESKEILQDIHHPKFQIDEDILKKGTAIWATIIYKILENEKIK